MISGMQSLIEQKLSRRFHPTYLNIENESHMHSGPATESHFKVTVVSDDFIGKPLIARHRAINDLLQEELQTVHALTLHTLTPDEYFSRAGKVADSPLCQGGSKT